MLVSPLTVGGHAMSEEQDYWWNVYSDVHKEVYGFRPHEWLENMDVQSIKDEITKLDNMDVQW
jgi:hypothetical protein